MCKVETACSLLAGKLRLGRVTIPCGFAWHHDRPGAQVAFLAGCLYTLVGVLRLGWLTNFLSHSVIAGFMTGASVIIGLSQARSAICALS